MTLYCDKLSGSMVLLNDLPDSRVEKTLQTMPKKLREGMANSVEESLRALDGSYRRRIALIASILKISADPMLTDDREIPWYFSEDKKNLVS